MIVNTITKATPSGKSTSIPILLLLPCLKLSGTVIVEADGSKPCVADAKE
jgi:hypothetical protein